jgi:hypothetical protein
MRTREINQLQRASVRFDFSRSRLLFSTIRCSAHLRVLTFSSSRLHSSLQCPPPSISHNLCQYSIAICTPHVAASQPAYACLFALHTRTGRNMHITYTSPSDTDSFTQPQQSACMPIPSPTTIARRSRQDRLIAPRRAALRCHRTSGLHARRARTLRVDMYEASARCRVALPSLQSGGHFTHDPTLEVIEASGRETLRRRSVSFCLFLAAWADARCKMAD